jgi:L-rhamnose mutarotase
MSQRVCFTMRINPEFVDEYEQRHAEVWPEMLKALSESGWTNYSLFMASDGELIGYLECEDFAMSLELIGRTEVNTRWQTSVAKFFVELDGRAPDDAMRPLKEVFHLD